MEGEANERKKKKKQQIIQNKLQLQEEQSSLDHGNANVVSDSTTLSPNHINDPIITKHRKHHEKDEGKKKSPRHSLTTQQKRRTTRGKEAFPKREIS